MASSPAVMIVIALAAGGVAAVGTASFASGMSGTDPAVQAEAASTLRAIEALRNEVERLSDSQASLRGQVQSLDLRLATASAGAPAQDQPEPLVADTSELIELREQVAQLSARMGGEDTNEPVAIETVSAALEQIREEEDQERAKLRSEARKEREGDRLAELTEKLTLDGYQQGKMSDLMAEYGESSAGIIEDARKNSDWGSIRGDFSTLHGTLDESLTGFLTPAQLDELQAMGGAQALNSSGWGNWGRSNSSSNSNGD
jgi:hypothetical protein